MELGEYTKEDMNKAAIEAKRYLSFSTLDEKYSNMIDDLLENGKVHLTIIPGISLCQVLLYFEPDRWLQSDIVASVLDMLYEEKSEVSI